MPARRASLADSRRSHARHPGLRARRFDRRPAPPCASSGSGGSPSATSDLRKRPIAPGELRRFVERLGARALLDATDAAVPRRRSRLPEARRRRDRRAAAGRPAPAAVAARPPRQRGDGGSGRERRWTEWLRPRARALSADQPTTHADDQQDRADDRPAHVVDHEARARMMPEPWPIQTSPTATSRRGDDPAIAHADLPGGILARWMQSARMPAGPAGCGSRPRPSEKLGRDVTARPRTRSSSSADPSTAFLDTDPWRALRILAEFVEGFDAMAKVGPAVTVFGSARTMPGRSALRAGPDDRAAPGRGRLRGHHRRRPGHHGGRQPGLPRGRGTVGRLQHRAAARAGAQPRTSTSASSSATSSRARRCS